MHILEEIDRDIAPEIIVIILNYGLVIYGSVIRWKRGGRIATDDLLEAAGWFMAIWTIINAAIQTFGICAIFIHDY